jgi:hypothetical protein
MAERKWRLGVHARGHPSLLMNELLRVMQVRGIILCDHWCLPCRCANNAGIRARVQHVVVVVAPACIMLCLEDQEQAVW